MNDQFIHNIEIRNYKLFQNFKAEGFGRVNLIGGKNNVGKTAFLEACFISQASDVFELYNKILETKTHRNAINRLLAPSDKKQDIEELIHSSVGISISSSNSFSQITLNKDYQYEIFTGNNNNFMFEFSKLTEILDINFQQAKTFYSTDFIAQDMSPDWLINFIVSKAKLEDKYEILNKYLQDVFSIKNIDTIENLPYLKKSKKYEPLSEFGQGIKSFIEIATSLLFASKKSIFIDEIENGIHYTNYDKLWDIILSLSKNQDIQIFATTHSKECIESYARVAKRLEDEEIRFISFYKDKNDSIKSLVFDQHEIETRLELGLDNR